MAIEVEQKFRVADVAQFERQLAELDSRHPADEVQVDRYFAHPQRDFAHTDEALRLRQVGTHNYITYKGPKLDATTKTRREIEIELAADDSGAAAAGQLLEALSFRPVLEVRKRRRHCVVNWQGTDIGISLDHIERLGHFVELEIVTDEQGLEPAKALVASLASHLKLSKGERRSYLELLLELPKNM